jgi:hypothetical protein
MHPRPPCQNQDDWEFSGVFCQLAAVLFGDEGADLQRYCRELDRAARVAKFMHQFVLPHAFAFYSGVLKLADDHDRLVNVAGYILTHEIERLTNRDVQRGCRTMRKLERRDTRGGVPATGGAGVG